MATKIFVNLPVKDLDKSMAFYKALGFSFNEQFTDATAACLVITDDIFAMLLTHEKFSQFTTREIADTSKVVECINALSWESREKVDELVSKAIAAGVKENGPAMDHGFMYQRSISDPDGHVWEFFWMDPAFAEGQAEAATSASA